MSLKGLKGCGKDPLPWRPGTGWLTSKERVLYTQFFLPLPFFMNMDVCFERDRVEVIGF